jgi:hypothetical protein
MASNMGQVAAAGMKVHYRLEWEAFPVTNLTNFRGGIDEEKNGHHHRRAPAWHCARRE